MAGRHHGPALVRGRDARSRPPVPHVNGHLHLPKLRAALEAHFTKNVTAVSQNEDQKVA